MLLIMGGVLFWLWGCTTPGGRTPGQVVDDGTITTKVKTKIYADSELRWLGISVATFKGRVTLTGEVSSGYKRKKVEKLARTTDGVQRVINHIKIK